MVFSSLTFLFFFLPMVLLVYYLSPKKIQNTVLLVISLIFYAWGEPVYVGLILFSACTDYVHGLLIKSDRSKQRLKAKLALLSSLILNLGLLSFFKYADFLIENINHLLATEIPFVDLPLPIGISFYTFQTLSYTIDVYRGRVAPQKNPLTLLMYVSLFPQLIAGPIVRYQSIEAQLHRRKWDSQQFADGVKIFIIGLGKKVLIANNIGLLWNHIQHQPIEQLTVLAAWLGILAFAFQIYFDFGGYSDMAIGLGKMLGFDFPVNFNYPYVSKGVAEFWRRWHITLGVWFRDYVYIPLGGSRSGKWKTYRNLLIVWSLTGLWHGASWNFIIWGLYFGVFIAIERAGWLAILQRLPRLLQHFYLLLVITISWVFFVFENFLDSVSYLSVMFGLSGNRLFDSPFLYHLYSYARLILIAAVCATPIYPWLRHRLTEVRPRWSRMWLNQFLPIAFYILVFILSTAYLVDQSFNPFLYFRF